MNEAERMALFRANRMAESFLSVMLQDAQHSESDEACTDEREARDVGTIYTCPDATLRAVLCETDAFRASLLTCPGLAALLDDSHLCAAIGSDLYLERAGHGAGFQDRDIWHRDSHSNAVLAVALSGRVAKPGTLETYLGDDGQLWIVGKESA